MPRHVDPEQRRQLVAEAVWRVVVRSGLGRATVRTVADEAGLSVGALRHYFGEQRGLKIYALQLINERAGCRLASVDMSGPVRERIEQTMWALLPVTPEQVEEEQVRLAFLLEARSDPALASIVRDEHLQALHLTRRAIHGLIESALAPAVIDVDAVATELLALLDGLTQTAALFPDIMDAHTLQRTVRAWLDNLAHRVA